MLTETQKSFVRLVEEKFGPEYTISRKEIISLIENTNVKYPQWISGFRVSHGQFKVPAINPIVKPIVSEMPVTEMPVVENVVAMKKVVVKETKSMVPEKDPNFEKFGFYNDLKNIIKSKMFFPIFISGHSGLGKTYMVLQACAELKRECIRVNFSTETDENCLLGGPTLVDGNIVHTEGPVVTCLRNGWVLLLDEIDRGNQNNVLILNGILEGKGYYNPRTGEFIKASEGFTVITTANTKGYGSEDGKYLSQIMDSAFLERFFITLEQPNPPEKVEQKILFHHLDDNDFNEKLVKWANVIRKTYQNGGIDELISTRRLVHIVETFKVFKNKLKAIDLCCSRYDSQVKDAFIDLYQKIDAGANIDENGELIEPNIVSDEIKF